MNGPWEENGTSMGNWIAEYCTRGSAGVYDAKLFEKCMEYWALGKDYRSLRFERRPNWGEDEQGQGDALSGGGITIATAVRASSPLRTGAGGLKSFKALREALEVARLEEGNISAGVRQRPLQCRCCLRQRPLQQQLLPLLHCSQRAWQS